MKKIKRVRASKPKYEYYADISKFTKKPRPWWPKPPYPKRLRVVKGEHFAPWDLVDTPFVSDLKQRAFKQAKKDGIHKSLALPLGLWPEQDKRIIIVGKPCRLVTRKGKK